MFKKKAKPITPVDTHMLLFTDGYSINAEKFQSLKSAQDAMNTQYKRYCRNERNDFWDKMSYNDESRSAILYDKGENIFVWRIIDL